MKLRIGTHGNPKSLWQARYTRAALLRIGVESELVTLNGADSGYMLETALLRGDIDLAVHTLSALPTRQPGGLAITAVSERQNPADVLLIRPEAFDKSSIFRLKPGAKVAHSTAMQWAQLSEFRSDTHSQNLMEAAPQCLEKLQSGDFDALILAAEAVAAYGLDVAGLEQVVLNPAEIIPVAGQGVIAWQANRDDLETRRTLQKIHRPEASACTNIERGVLQLMEAAPGLPPCVFCERDRAGNYHAFAAWLVDGVVRRARLSQNTNAGMAERIVAALS